MKRHYLSYLSDAIAGNWDKPALTNYGEEQEYTFGDLAREIMRLHTLFRLLGVKKGDKIAITGRNSANWGVAYLAIMTYEAVVVSILQDFKAEDIRRLVEHSDSKLLFCGPYVWRDLQSEQMPTLSAIIGLQDFDLLRGEADAQAAIAAWADEFKKEYPAESVQPEDINFNSDLDELCLINYTSGSTGSPKGVMLNARSLSSNVETGMDFLPAPKDGTVVSILPMAHMFGQVAEFLYPLCSGCHIYFLTKTPTPTILLKALQEVQPYEVVMVPLVIEKIYKKNIASRISSKIVRAFWKTPIIGGTIRNKVKKTLKKSFGGNIKYFLLGGAALNPEVEDCLLDIRFPLTVGYGMTECGPLIGGNPPSKFKARSCGKPVLNMEVKIDEPNDKGIGEILVKGENVMLGYYKNPEATRAAFTHDGWMRTGDLGYLDRHKNIYLKGRNKTMILGASGQNIYPEEIEDKLNNLEGVGESIVVEREGKLIGLVFPDEQTTKGWGLEDIERLMKENLQKLNKLIPGYSQVSHIEIKEEPFEKTPKKSIKRFLYK
ncbi:MAG: AMP-binding protein [Paludibacteraceae bacterium]|nr:AMP-binding protein [Paludibacteraceae bacterium]